MTKDEIVLIIKRYRHITIAIKNGFKSAVYYIGKRKSSVEITEEVIAVCEVISDVYSAIDSVPLRRLVDGILSNKSDVSLIIRLPWEKNAYYKRKAEFISTVYNCCIAKGLVSYSEILENIF